MPPRKNLEHITLPSEIRRSDYTPVSSYFGDDRPKPTARQNRYLHANKLKDDLDRAIQARAEKRVELIRLVESIPIESLPFPNGICLDVEGADHLQLNVEKLEDRRGKTPIEVLNIRVVDGKIRATIFIPDRKLDSVQKKISKYGEEARDTSGTKDFTISVDSIEAMKIAELDSFWMDETPMPTELNQIHIWEAWVRRGQVSLLQHNADKYGIRISNHSLKFQECEICLISCTLNQLALLQIMEMPLVGYGFREPTPGFFIDLKPYEQTEWLDNLIQRITYPDNSSPAVCILDTGVRQTHHLLSGALHQSDCDAYEPGWTPDDHDGHGTQMAGLALMGDLSHHLSTNERISLNHRLESVKILPPNGENAEEMYGVITEECVNRAIVNGVGRKRVFCLAVTHEAKFSDGKPSSWSSTIDKICAGVTSDFEIDDDRKQLFFLSVGNIRGLLNHGDYPSRNDRERAENPSQSWNGVSVGAISEKAFSEDQKLNGWEIVAPPGQISPTSRTSINWLEKDWPIKPEIVFEGGNRITDGSFVSDDPDLSLLTTGHSIPLALNRDTSAATAQAARMAAILQAKYPSYWPETIRGLMIHSATWNNSMLGGSSLSSLRSQEKENLLRRYGWGQPDLDLAMFSASNRACMISQHTIQPFNREEDDGYTGYNEINIHSLPWPVEYLAEFSDVRIQLRVTLSYFIEPSPSKRLPIQKFSYASHGLRFDLQRPLEADETFLKRVNKKARTEGEKFETTDTTTNWVLGPQARDKGCIISDIWRGTAAQLQNQGMIIIKPEGGWWRFRKHLERYNTKCRYSLIVSVEMDNEDVDIYTQIKNMIRVQTQISV